MRPPEFIHQFRPHQGAGDLRTVRRRLCSLCRGVARHMGKRTQALATGDLDYPSPSGSPHVGDELLNQTNTRDDIDLVTPAPFVSGTIEPGVLRIHARTVDEDVDRPERCLRARCEPADVGWNREISEDE